MPELELHAWVDESMHAPSDDGGDGLYLLGCAVADPHTCDAMRTVLRSMTPPGKERLHWHDEDDDFRMKIAAAISEMDLVKMVVIGSPYDPRKDERARRQCMERLFVELNELGVSQVTLESRGPRDAKDVKWLTTMIGKGMLRTLRARHGLPLEEPMLWVPDAIAGAAGMARKRSLGGPLEALGTVEHIAVTLT